MQIQKCPHGVCAIELERLTATSRHEVGDRRLSTRSNHLAVIAVAAGIFQTAVEKVVGVANSRVCRDVSGKLLK